MKLQTRIVGLRHKNIDPKSIPLITKSKITFVQESENVHDKFAVQCLSNYFNIGYIEATKSQRVFRLLEQNTDYSVKVLAYDDFSIKIEITFNTIKVDGRKIKTTAIGRDIAGIYRILFFLGEEKYAYIGQSVDIDKRLKTHYRDLENLQHHNSIMQSAWIEDSTTFSDSILHKVPENIDGLDRQIYLFQKELYYIKVSSIPTANRVDADMVLTEDAKRQLEKLIKAVKLKLKQKRLAFNDKKDEIGQRFIDLGIIEEKRFWDGYQRGNEPRRYLTVSASNVLTWINKRRRSPMDYIPPINYTHPKFNELKDQLIDIQTEIRKIESQGKFLDESLNQFTHKAKRQPIQVDDLEKFLKLLKSI